MRTHNDWGNQSKVDYHKKWLLSTALENQSVQPCDLIKVSKLRWDGASETIRGERAEKATMNEWETDNDKKKWRWISSTSPGEIPLRSRFCITAGSLQRGHPRDVGNSLQWSEGIWTNQSLIDASRKFCIKGSTSVSYQIEWVLASHRVKFWLHFLPECV